MEHDVTRRLKACEGPGDTFARRPAFEDSGNGAAKRTKAVDPFSDLFAKVRPNRSKPVRNHVRTEDSNPRCGREHHKQCQSTAA